MRRVILGSLIVIILILFMGCPNPDDLVTEAPLPANIIIKYDGSELPLIGTIIDIGTVVVGSSIGPLSFTITNSGGSDLHLTGSPWVVISGDTDQFSIGGTPNTTLAAGQTETFSITYSPLGTGTHSVLVSVEHDDPDDPAVELTINATATAVPEPEIAVYENATPLWSGSGSFDFGDQKVGGSNSVTFTINNEGTAALDFSGTPLVDISGTGASAYLVTTYPGTTIAVGASSDFIIQFNPVSSLTFDATVTIENNDTDEGTYTFDLTGTGTVPNIAIRQGATSLQNSSGSYDFGGLTIGDLGIPVDFTIDNSGTAELVLDGSPRAALSGSDASQFSVTVQPSATVDAGGYTVLSIRFQPTSGGAKTVTVTVENDDPDDKTYTFTITGTALTPDISISKDAVTYAHGSGSYEFSPIHNNETRIETFWINNDGAAGSYLRLVTPNSVVVSGADAANFSIVQPVLSDIPATGTDYTIFTIEFDPSNRIASLGNFNATVSIYSNDPDTSPYTFSVTGDTFYQNYTTHGTSGTGAGEFQTPVDVVYNPVNSRVYVLDRLGDKVLVFDDAGTYESEFGPTGTDNGVMANPEALVVDSAGNLYIVNGNLILSNPGFNYVQKFDKDGVWQAGWGANGSGDGDFQSPSGIAIGPGDEVFISDSGANRVQVFSSSGVYDRQWSVTEPSGIAVFSGGLVLVVSYGTTYIQKYTDAGVALGDFGTAVGGGFDIKHIALDDFFGNLFVSYSGTDSSNGIWVYNDVGKVVGFVTTGDLGIAKIFAGVRGATFGGGYLYFVNDDVNFPDLYGDDLLIRVQRLP